ncbi:MAG: hypothetical protein J3Q66DRAFT_442018 [Benniella sp.]|nr:MAG: hypothetical protein J3Q66DRAFT_442018 [Benniella sp.]
MPWMTFRRLHERLLYQTKIGLEHCRAIIENQEEESTNNDRVKEHKQDREDMSSPAEPQPPPDLQPQLQQATTEQASSVHDSSMSCQGSGQQWPGEEHIQGHSPLQQNDPALPQRHHHHHSNQRETQHQQEYLSHRYGREAVHDELQNQLGKEVPIPSSSPDERRIPDTDGHKRDDESDDRGQGEGQDVDEEEAPSWIEEQQGDEEQASIGGMGLEDDTDSESGQMETRWQVVEDEEWEEDEDEDEGKTRIGIIDDLEADQADWDPESFLSEQLQLRRNVNRVLEQQQDNEAGLKTYRRHSRTWKRQLPPHYLDQKIQGLVPTVPVVKPPMAGRKRHIKWSPLPAECLSYESWTMTDWDVFFDLNPFRRYVRILTRESMSMAYLADRFNFTLTGDEETNPLKANKASTETSLEADTEAESEDEEENGDEESEESEGGNAVEGEKKVIPLLRTAGDVLFFDDTSLYDYRFTENPDAAESLRTQSKFNQEFTIDWLSQRPERLIHLGSVFGTGRVAIDSLESRAWQLMVRDHMILSTDILQATTQRIVDKVSGNIVDRPGELHLDKQTFDDPVEVGFVGFHIRMSDGHFSLTARDTIENIRQELMWQMDNENEYRASSVGIAGRMSIEQCQSRALYHRHSLEQQLQQQQQQKHYQEQQTATTADVLVIQLGPNATIDGRFTPIYLATDAHQPRSNPIFDKLFETFNCGFPLDDFTEDLESLYQYRNPEDGALMAKFLIPMVKSAAFFGTPACTFSIYVQKQLCPAYTGLYD